MPQTPISIPHFPLSNLNQVEHSDTQPDIVQHLVGVNRVDLTNERLVCRDSELVRFYRDGILPKREEMSANVVIRRLRPRGGAVAIGRTLIMDRTNIPARIHEVKSRVLTVAHPSRL